MTDFSPAQMQEMIRRGREAITTFRDAAREGRIIDFRQRDPLVDVLHRSLDALEQAASQAAEIERLTKERASNALEFMEAANQVALEWHEEKTRADRAESRLLALREQVEGLRGHPCPYCNGYGEAKADVLALFDPAQEKP
jgi:hypothetical protein